MSTDSLLTVSDLVVDYGNPRRGGFRALHGVDIDIRPGECLGLVGASGSGKSTLGKAILGLAPPSAGTITFDGEDITHAKGARRRALASSIQVVFQDPYGSLDPTMTVGQILSEPLTVSGTSRQDAAGVVAEMLDRVELPRDCIERYPSEFSGGQRQRIAIARALVRRPKLIVCDEPVSALDLTTQSVILDLFIQLQRDTGVSYLFVTHDLGVVRRTCHRVAVMNAGEIVEFGDGPQVTGSPQHEHTRELMMASPVADPELQRRRREEWLAQRGAA